MHFGHDRRADFLLDDELTYLNHGTVGVAHRAVLAAQRALVDQIEANPARFLLRELADHDGTLGRLSRMRQAIAPVARFVGTRAADTAFVDNITTGANAVLRSFPLRPGDEVLVTDLGYGGVTNAAMYAARTSGAQLTTVSMPWPATPTTDYVGAIVEAISPRTRLLVIDHLTAQTAVLLPVADIAAACRARGVAVLADGAHVPGNVALDVAALGVDWYVANLHKWALAPRSCGFIWAAPDRQADLHPAVISWGLDNGMAAEFDLPGTRDPSPMLTAPLALEVLAGYGLEDVYRHNHDLAWWAGGFLSDKWDVPFSTPESMIAAMVTVRLPASAGSDPEQAMRIQGGLQAQGIEVPVFAKGDALWTRVSVQIYNERADIERLAGAVRALCHGQRPASLPQR